MKNVLLALCTLGLAAGAAAEEERFAPPDETYRAECGGCHVAYPAELLPQGAWKAVLEGLSDHFGTEATVEPAALEKISSDLARHARPARQGEPLVLRITETRWFLHEHEEVPSSAWSSEEVKSAANCGACHTGADRGQFDEHAVRIPGAPMRHEQGEHDDD